MPSPTLTALAALRTVLAAIPLGPATEIAAGSVAPLFEAVAFATHRDLTAQLRDQMLAQDRVCLLVPQAVRRTVPDATGALGVLGSKHLAVDLLYSDRALFESGRTATFGGEAHLGLLAFDDLLEAALTGCELTPFGALVLGDSEPLVMTAGDRAADPTRHAWVTTLLLPTGLIAAAVG